MIITQFVNICDLYYLPYIIMKEELLYARQCYIVRSVVAKEQRAFKNVLLNYLSYVLVCVTTNNQML